ncbi:metallophosphatase [Antrihabitans spumae]|uniref:Metallophosphatase n=1 Tax=Antrihabitans spumae TaxID=3373370 RepID=A0ABW7KD60_9NOCA
MKSTWRTGGIVAVFVVVNGVGADTLARGGDDPIPQPAVEIPAIGLVADPAPLSSTMVAGISETSAPDRRIGFDETSASTLATTGADEFPYLRYTVKFTPGTEAATVSWRGRSVNRNDIAMHVWDAVAQTWGTPVAAATPVTPGGVVELSAQVTGAERFESGTAAVLVIDSPRLDEGFETRNALPDQQFANPESYDFALQHITDTQYISRDDPEVYESMTQWTVDNAEKYKVAYSMHTGDLVQSHIRPGRPEDMARKEFEVASESMKILEDAGIPHGVLPGNHDNLWNAAGRMIPGEHEKNHALYNEFFGPQRYQDRPYWGDSFTDEDNSAHYDLIDIAGAKLLMLYLGYNPPDKVMRWAEGVLDDHPDHNAVIGTHYYLNEFGDKPNMGFSDIHASSGAQIWNRLVKPYDSVFMVLSGHIDGQATVIDHNVGRDGRTVTQLLSDYQYFEVEGERRTGFQRMLQFDIDAGKLAVTTHSPTLGSFHPERFDPQNRYEAGSGEFVVDFTLPADLPRRVSAEG